MMDNVDLDESSNNDAVQRQQRPPPRSVEIQCKTLTVPRAADDDDELDHGNQLPDVEEYKAAAPPARPRSKMSQRRCKQRIILAVSFVIVIVVSVTIGVIVGRDTAPPGNTDSSNPFSSYWGNDAGDKNSPTSPPDEGETIYRNRQHEISELVAKLGWSDALKVNEDGSPQFLAAKWMADEDPANLDIEDALDFRQRYALVVIYYSLTGETESWENVHMPWLSQENVCKWRTAVLNENGDGSYVEFGVRCYGGSVVKELFLPNVGAEGTIPDEIQLLYDLEGLWLNDNAISGKNGVSSNL